jgi:hypothetical protein
MKRGAEELTNITLLGDMLMSFFYTPPRGVLRLGKN